MWGKNIKQSRPTSSFRKKNLNLRILRKDFIKNINMVYGMLYNYFYLYFVNRNNMVYRKILHFVIKILFFSNTFLFILYMFYCYYFHIYYII